MTYTIDIEAIRKRNTRRVEGHRPIRVGDEVLLSEYSNGDSDELTPAEVRGTVTRLYDTTNWGEVATIGGKDCYLEDYYSHTILGITAKEDVEILITEVEALRKKIEAVAQIHKRQGLPYISVCICGDIACPTLKAVEGYV